MFPGYMERYTKSRTLRAVDAYVKVAKDAGLSPTALALAWCQQQWYVGSSIIGATSMEQLRECVAGFAKGPLPDEVLDACDAVYDEFRDPTLSRKTRAEKRAEKETMAAAAKE